MSVPYPVVSVVPTGTATARYIQALALGCDDMYTALQMADRWKDTPQVKATLELRMKAAVSPMSTTDATAAGPLSVYGVAQEAITIQRGLSIFGAFEGQMQRVPLHVKIPVETGAGISGGWVAEGAHSRAEDSLRDQHRRILQIRRHHGARRGAGHDVGPGGGADDQSDRARRIG